MALVDLGPADQIAEGEKTQFEVGGLYVLACRVNGGLYAIDAICPHRGAFLTQGTLEGPTVRCPWHAWEFDITTGQGITNPMSCVRQYDIREENGRLLIEV